MASHATPSQAASTASGHATTCGHSAAAIERAILRPLSGQPVISVLMATIGLASALHGTVDAIWGGNNYEMPELLPRKPLASPAEPRPGAGKKRDASSPGKKKRPD